MTNWPHGLIIRCIIDNFNLFEYETSQNVFKDSQQSKTKKTKQNKNIFKGPTYIIIKV